MRLEVLDPILDPLHRPPQADGGARHQDLLGIEEHDLRAEGAADVGRDHLHLELGQAEDPREPVLDGQRRLGRDPRLERPRARVEIGHDAASLDGAAAAPLDPQPLAEHAGGAGKGGIRIAHALHEPARAIGGHVPVNQRRPARERGFQLGDGGQRLVAHLDQLGGVLGDVAILRDHERDHLAHVADAVGGERRLGARLGEGGMRDEERRRLVQLAEVGRRQDQVNAGQGARPRRVDRHDARMAVRTAEAGGVQHPLEVDVVHEAAEAAEQPRVLVAGNARADHPRAHDRGASAARRGCTTCGEQRARSADGTHDVHVAGAPAEVARQPDADLLVARPRVLLEQRADRHQDARGAEAALKPVLLVKRLLNRMKVLGVGRQALDGGDLATVDLDGQEQARPHRHAVEQDGAGAADAVLAPHVRPRQA